MTQTQYVRACLKKGRRVSSLEMFEHGITRLSGIIYHLRHHYGMNIIATKHKAKNGSTYAVYTLGS
ncbi:MAG: hypothetical protein IJR46_05165 [Neisseriaceae bacterium]|nr:hypothetical protein [Neisseriaceae bacterium]